MQDVAAKPWDITDLVIYAPSGPQSNEEGQLRKMLDVREFEIAKALLEGKVEELSQKLPSQWGEVHLFDVCLGFGHANVAMAMATHGVKGCELQMHHLEPWKPKLFHAEAWGWRRCRCTSHKTCRWCCWGFPEENGAWMTDWDLQLDDVISQAWEVAEQPWVRSLLDFMRKDAELPCSVSQQGMARLLDIAVLIGESQTAQAIAGKCQCFPLRRWRSSDFVKLGEEEGDMTYRYELLRAALSANVNLGDLRTANVNPGDHRPDLNVPLGQALFLKCNRVWDQIQDFLPRKAWSPSVHNNVLGSWFLSRADNDPATVAIDLHMLRNSVGAGVDLSSMTIEGFWRDPGASHHARGMNLLDLAILMGQAEASAACCEVASFTRMTDAGCQLYAKLLNDDPLPEFIVFGGLGAFRVGLVRVGCISAARAAGLAMLRKSFRLHAQESGLAIYQVMKKMCAPRPLPIWLVKEVLFFSMGLPALIEQLDLWKEIAGWESLREPAQAQESKGTEPLDSECPDEPQRPEEDADVEPTDDVPGVDQKNTEDLMQAIQASRDHVPALNVDGVCIFRLMRNSKSPEVTSLLMDHLGPLWKLHKRVLEAGCEVAPLHSPVKCLFVPCTEEQLLELLDLEVHGYELCREQHLLALQSDFEIIDKALRSYFKKVSRPKLKKLCPRGHEPPPSEQSGSMGSNDVPGEAAEEDDPSEPVLVLERGFRTDSSLGFPSYQIQ